MSSTENTVFHSNLHHLLNEASVIPGFSTACSMLSRHHYWADWWFVFTHSASEFPQLSKEKASTNKLALKVNSFRLGLLKVGRKFYRSLPSKCFPSCALLSRHRNRSMEVHTEWHSCARGQSWHLRELQLISGRLKVVSWVASGERRSCKTSPSLTKQSEESGKQVFHSRG